jgi:hypothetical protein
LDLVRELSRTVALLSVERFTSPKNRGPDQWAPVISCAMRVSEE